MLDQLLLASSSPRRQQILHSLVGPKNYRIISSSYEEDNTLELSPEELVKKHALGKIHNTEEEGIIIGGDLIGICEQRRLFRPKDESDARDMLNYISGKTVDLIGAVAVSYNGKQAVDVRTGQVVMRPMSEEEIDFYIATGEPLDKAGAFAVQGIGAMFIKEFHGDYFHIVGLSVLGLRSCLDQVGVDLLQYCTKK